MPKQVQLRRGTTTEHATFTGVVGEVTVDTTKDTLVVHDGTQAGGYPLARESALANYQPLDGDLTAIAALSGTTGIVRKTAANTYSLDTDTYLTGITSTQVTTALGFTPYNATNPSGYLSTVNLTSNVTGALPVANGGTGATTLTGYVKGNGTSTMTASAAIPVADVTGAAPLADPTFTGTVVLPSTTSIGTVSSTEIGYLDNVTSAIQTQLNAKAPLAAPTFTGTSTFATTDALGPVRQNIVAVAALDIDCSLGNFFTKTIAGNSTFTFSNAPSTRAFAFTLEVTHTSGTITWPTTVRWPGGTAPTLTTSRVHLITFVTDDAGTNWRAASQVNYTA
jgi:hypothetical protein